MIQSTTGSARSRKPFGGWLLGLLGRVTSGGRFIAEIDGLRFIAIGTVLLFHLAVDLAAKAPQTYALPKGGLLATVALQGFHGVELFFVISGFVLALPYAASHLRGRPHVPLGTYLLRRLTRLEPPYVLSLLIMFVALLVFKDRRVGELGPHLGASLVYLHNLIYRGESWINNVAWSLEIEIQFYLLVPLLSQLFAIRGKLARRGLLVAIATALIAWQVLALSPGDLAWLSILRFGQFFLAGFLLADVYLTDWNEAPVKSLAWDAVSALGWPLLFWIWAHYDPEPRPGQHLAWWAVAFPALVFLLYMATFRGRITNRIICNPWLTTYGGMCYSLYLLHNPIIGVLLRASSALTISSSWEVNFLFQAVLVLPAMSALATLFFLAVEKPCMRRDWPQRLWAAVHRAPAGG